MSRPKESRDKNKRKSPKRAIWSVLFCKVCDKHFELQRLSKENYQKYKDEINPKNYIRTLCGIEGGYQLDHIKSIKQCFNKGLSPKIVAKKNNLQMLPWKENL